MAQSNNKIQLLSNIDTPDDLKGLSIDELKQLAEEIRTLIIEVVSSTGGHLASSLGTVELCIALHYVFNTPGDKIFWDVSHQTYAHKILTGRKDRFHTLRQKDGLSGFSRPAESPYDEFVAGHASTSIAAALGAAIARDRNQQNHNVIAVIGDGAMTGGLAYEALNNLGQLGIDMLIILNDNEMSIARNVGAITRIFTRLITHNFYNIAKEDLEDFIRKFARRLGSRLVKFTQRVEESIKGLIVPGIFFEEMGIRYIGPINGNDLPQLIGTLKKVKSLRGPRLLHILTKKGKGYPPAEEQPEKFHSAPPFVIETGETKKSGLTYTEVFGKALCELAQKDKKIVAITAAMPDGTGLREFADSFPERFFDVGIAEACAVTLAAGMARSGLKPVVCIYSTFLQRAFDQIIHDVALQNLPVLFAIDRAGIVGQDGPTHHGMFDLSYLRLIPGMSIMAPKDDLELRSMLYTVLSQDKFGPVAIRYPRGKSPGLSAGVKTGEFNSIPWSKAELLYEGDTGIILAVGHFVELALKTADLLKKDGIKIAVANMRFVKPLDEEFLQWVAENYDNIFSLEDNTVVGGFGSGVNELFVLKNFTHRQCIPFGFPDKFIEHGKPAELYEQYGLTPQHLSEVIKTHILHPSRSVLTQLLPGNTHVSIHSQSRKRP